jgi:hypothetical protein
VVLYELLSRSVLLSWRLAAATAAGAPDGGSAGAAVDAGRGGRWPGAPAGAPPPGAAGVRNAFVTTPDGAAMLSHALRAADGERPPPPPFWPPEVAELVAACCAQEPHERPRMGEVLQALKALAGDERVVSALDAYVNKDVDFAPAWLAADGGGAPASGRDGGAEAGAAPAGSGEISGAASDGGSGRGSVRGSGRGSAGGGWSSRGSVLADGACNGSSRGGASARAAPAARPEVGAPAQQPCGCVVC